jgi:hypothetical protein
MDRRFAILSKALRDEVAYARFVADFAEILNRRQASKTANSAQDHDFFRYHDSGDVQSVTHLEMINDIAELTPGIAHWLPTRETGMVAGFLRKNGNFAANLLVRVSAPMVDGKVATGPSGYASGVHTTEVPADGQQLCIAYTQDGECRDCRACWDFSVKTVSYPKH